MLKLSELALHNAKSLQKALHFCRQNRIGAFRVLSQVLPLKTHPDAGYAMEELPNYEEIIHEFKICGSTAREADIRLSFHPDQFILLNSPRAEVVDSSVKELEYQAEVADWIGGDVLNIHGGGGYGDKAAALDRLKKSIEKLPDRIRQKLSLENDDRVYSPSELLPVCRQMNIPFVYDVHHHRCLPDGKTIAETTDEAVKSWNSEPLFHISSPIKGWEGPKPNRHHDYIDINDFPPEWREIDLTVEVEAKAKELAVIKLRKDLERLGIEIKTRKTENPGH